MNRSAAEIVREYGPFPGVDHVHGVAFDGQHVWFASGDKLNAFDPASGKTVRSIDVAAHAGTAFDGRHLFQIAEDRIQKVDPTTGRVPSVGTIVVKNGFRFEIDRADRRRIYRVKVSQDPEARAEGAEDEGEK